MKELRQAHKHIISIIAVAMPLGATPSQILKEMPELSAQNLNAKLNIMLKRGIIEKRKEGILTYYIIAPEGIKEIPRLVVEQPPKPFIPTTTQPPPASQPEPTQITARAHKFGIAYPLKDPLTTDTPTQLLALAGIPAGRRI